MGYTMVYNVEGIQLCRENDASALGFRATLDIFRGIQFHWVVVRLLLATCKVAAVHAHCGGDVTWKIRAATVENGAE